MKEEGGKLEEDNRERGGGRRARRLYVAIKFNIITSRTETKAGNKQDISKDCDLGAFILPVYLFCMMVHFTRSERGEKGARAWYDIKHNSGDSRPEPMPICRN